MSAAASIDGNADRFHQRFRACMRDVVSMLLSKGVNTVVVVLYAILHTFVDGRQNLTCPCSAFHLRTSSETLVLAVKIPSSQSIDPAT